MKAIFTLKKLIAVVFMALTAMVMNAQTQVNPWHVVVYDAGGTEIANHSVEIITDITVSADSVKFFLDNGTVEGLTFSYPITSTFAFDQRAGNGTAIETVAAPSWNVSYANGTLYFTQPVKTVAVYALSGVLIEKVSGNSTSVSVNLAKGLYIVQADGKAAKLLVANNGNGGTSVQPTIVNNVVHESTSTLQQSTSAANGNQTLLRAATAALKNYWNINAGNTITPIDISTVNTFYITTDNTIVFSMHDGNTIQLTQYHSTSFSTTPTASQNIDWDMANTILYGGCTYAWGYGEDFGTPPAITWAAVHKNGLAFHSVVIDNSFAADNRILNSAIDPKLWTAGNNPNSRLAVFFGGDPNYGMSYSITVSGLQGIGLMQPTGLEAQAGASDWSFNNNTNLIPTTIVKDGTKITMTCVDINGTTWTYSFITW